jgi:hypothetical protein
METHHHHHHATKNTPLHHSGLPSKEKKELSVSARKLAATLWEINDLTPSSVKKEPMRSNKDKVERLCRSVLLGSAKLDPLFSPFSEVNYTKFISKCHFFFLHLLINLIRSVMKIKYMFFYKYG